MQDVSNEYIKAFQSRAKQDKIEGYIKLVDGSLIEITDKDIVQGGLQTKNKVCGSSFDIGSFFIGEMQLKMIDDEALNHNFGGALVNLKYKLLVSKENDTWETVLIKPYYIDGQSVKRKRNIISCKAYDNASRFDKVKPDDINGMSMFDSLTYICAYCQVGIANTKDELEAMPNFSITPDFSSSQIQDCRDVIMWIAQTINCCAYIDYRGLLKFKPYSYAGYGEVRKILASERTSIEFSDTRTYMAYLSSYCNGEPKTYSKVRTWTGVDADRVREGAFIMPRNPLLNNLSADEQDQINKSYLENCQFPARYIKSKGWIDPAFEVLDVLAFTGGSIDVQKNVRNSATEIVWKYRGEGWITCNIVDEYTEEASETSTIQTFSADSETAITRIPPKSQLQKQIDSIESRISSGGSGGSGAGTLTEYTVLSDTAIKYNGTTYTFSAGDSGEITGVTTDKGGAFAPTIPGALANISMHNAAFMAVALLSKLGGEPTPTTDIDAAYVYNNNLYHQEGNYYIWDNQGYSDSATGFATNGSVIDDGGVLLSGAYTTSAFAYYGMVSEEYTWYCCGKADTTSLTLLLYAIHGGFEGGIVAGVNGEWVLNVNPNVSYNLNTGKSALNKTVIAYRRTSAGTLDIFINGVFWRSTANTATALVNGAAWGIGYANQSVPQCHLYGFALDPTAQSDDVIKSNSEKMLNAGG